MKDQRRQIHHPTTEVADRQMEQRAERAKELLSARYKGLRRAQERKAARRLQLEQRMAKIDGAALTESQKGVLRSDLAREEVLAEKESRRKMTTNDFEPLLVIGRGAFGEVTLVRTSTSKSGDGKIYAIKSMKKEHMRQKHQTHHVRAEREALSMADDRYQPVDSGSRTS